MKKSKIILLISLIFIVSGCTLPYQSKEYPAWNTNGLIDGEFINDKFTSAYQGLSIGDTAHTNDFDITVTEISLAKVTNCDCNKNNVSATIKIKNTSNDKKKIFLEDFPLMWNLQDSDANFTYPIKDGTGINYLIDETIIEPNQELNVDVIYEIDDNIKKPYAIYYGEVYENQKDGNSYYFYIK